ncbi:MAG: phage tail protein [Deferribacteres bacterium]|nr:phage tail protein [candidate division KSB1 bacterium]MCB9500669.1 phage tail protein [Deferribacteres bacterium]
MSEPYVGEIRMFAGSFAPLGWAFCEGQLLAVSQNDVLFSLLGTIYGGDGRTTFGLPDFRGRIPVHAGQGPGLSPNPLGAKGGQEHVTLVKEQLPTHSHTLNASTATGNESAAAGNTVSESPQIALYLEDAPGVGLNPAALTPNGASQSHTNMMPSLCLNFIIALYGIYPQRN